MAPSFTLWITFSQVSAPAGMFVMSADCSERPPVFSLSLWQTTQYLSTRARSLVTDGAVDGCWGGGAACIQAGMTTAKVTRQTMSFPDKLTSHRRHSGVHS